MTNTINPYNFFPLLDKKTKSNLIKGKLTGYIDYSVLTKTPLFIPNTSNEHIFATSVADHKSYTFFSYDNLTNEMNINETKLEQLRPVIPASEIRGLIRSNYEILTNSCLSSLDSDDILTKRTPEVFKAGIIEKKDGKYNLYDAKDYLFRSYKNPNTKNPKADNYKKQYLTKEYVEGQLVYFSFVDNGRGKPLVKNISKTASSLTKQQGYIIKGEDGPIMRDKYKEKHNCHVFVKTNKVLSDITLDTLKNVLKMYKENGQNTYTEYSKQLKLFINSENGNFPVYYSVEFKDKNPLLFLSPASITREVYLDKLKDIVGDYFPCESEEDVCPACFLFGSINNDLKITSRVRFTDLTCDNQNNLYEKKRVLAPLSSPKINNMEFYVKRPNNAVFWTYDYYVDAQGNVCRYNDKIRINGRKFYWHALEQDFTTNDVASNLNTTIKAVRKNIQFSGKVYFENLTKEELDLLIYTIESGDKNPLNTKKHGYKLGGAKPLGYGSIALSINNVCLRKLDKDTLNIIDEHYHSDIPKLDNELINNFNTMTCFNTVKTVEYPTSGKDHQIYQWFSDNHRGNRLSTSRKTSIYNEYLKPLSPNYLTAIHISNKTVQNNNGYAIGTVLKVVTTGHKPNGKFVKFKLPNGKESTAFDKVFLKDGTTIQVKYFGKDKNGYDRWEIIK